MKRRAAHRAAVLLAALLAIAAPVRAQSPEFAAAYRAFDELFAAGRYADAEAPAREALRLAEAELGPDHATVAKLLGNLAAVRQHRGDPDEAARLLTRALAIEERVLAPAHPRVGRTLQALAGAQWERGRFAAIEPLLQRALAIAKARGGPESPEIPGILADLAATYRALGRDAEAELLAREARKLRGAQRSPGR